LPVKTDENELMLSCRLAITVDEERMNITRDGRVEYLLSEFVSRGAPPLPYLRDKTKI